MSAPAGQPPLRDTLLDYTEIRLGIGAEFRPTQRVDLFASAGLIVHQEFDYFERDYELDANDPTPFLRIGARYRF